MGKKIFKNTLNVCRSQDSLVIPDAQMKEILKGYGISVPKGKVFQKATDAVSYAKKLGYPVVIKAVSDKILHKTELKAIQTDICSDVELRTAFGSMQKRFEKKQGFAGILVEEQIESGIEIIVGLQYDPAFGPVIMVGLGGIFTDLFKDVVFRMLPVSKAEIKNMLCKLQAWPLLSGYRGDASVNIDALIDTIHRISKFGQDAAPYYDSVDFNPIIATPKACSVVDAKLIISDEEHSLSFETPRIENMGQFFNPKSVAVVGASTTSGKIGNVILDTLLHLEFKGKVYPINPNYRQIMGVDAYPSLSALPEAPDLVVVIVDLKMMPDIIKEMAAIGSHNALIVSGGGKELGGDRANIEKEIYDFARKLKVRIIGPNCIGSFDGFSRFDSFFYHRDRMHRPPAGPMSFITQSGTWGCAFLEKSTTVGVSKMVSYGNRVEVDEGDLIAYLADDSRTKVIGSYIEGLDQGRKFVAAVDKAIKNEKPVVVFKTGRNEKSALASVSHTGAYGGSYHVYKGAFEQAGVVLADSFHELYAGCEALSLQPPAAGSRVALLSNGAGPMVNAIDLFPQKGLELVKLSRDTVKKMRDHFSFFYLVENPVDVTGSATSADYEYVIDTLFNDKNVDIIMPFFVFQNTPLDEQIVEKLERLNKMRKKPIVCCAAGGPYTDKMAKRLNRVGIPVFIEISQWVFAASSLVQWGQILKTKG